MIIQVNTTDTKNQSNQLLQENGFILKIIKTH